MLVMSASLVSSFQQSIGCVSPLLGSRALLRLLSAATTTLVEQRRVPHPQQLAKNVPQTPGPAAAAILHQQLHGQSALPQIVNNNRNSDDYELALARIARTCHTSFMRSSPAVWQTIRQYRSRSSRSSSAREAAAVERHIQASSGSEDDEWQASQRLQAMGQRDRRMQQWQHRQQQWHVRKQQYQQEDEFSSEDGEPQRSPAFRQHDHGQHRSQRDHQQRQQLRQQYRRNSDDMEMRGSFDSPERYRKHQHQDWRHQYQYHGHNSTRHNERSNWLAGNAYEEQHAGLADVYTAGHMSQSRSSHDSKTRSYKAVEQLSRLPENSPITAAATGPTLLEPAVLTSAIKRATTLLDLQKLLQDHKDNLQQINVCAAFKAVVRLSGQSNSATVSSRGTGEKMNKEVFSSRPLDPVALAVMRQLSSKMLSQIRTARPWDLAQAAWACSKLQYRDQALLNAIAQQAMRKGPILLPQDVSQLASAYARLSFPHKQLMQFLQQQTLAKAADFEPWSLIHMAWSAEVAGAAGTCMKQLLAVISQHVGATQVQKLQPLDVATLLWLMASHEYFNLELLDALVQQLQAQISKYSPAAVAQALISLAGLGYQSLELAEAAAPVVLQQLKQQQYSPKQVAHTTFALVKLGEPSQELLEAAAAAFGDSSTGNYSPVLLCMMCWAMNLGGYKSQSFTMKLLHETTAQLHNFTADQVASMVRGVLKMPGEAAQESQVTQLLVAAAHQLPLQLPNMSTPVLGRLIVALDKHRQLLLQLYTAPVDAPDSSSFGGVKGQPSEQLMQQLIQQCGQEWVQQGRHGQVMKWECSAVREALAAAGLHELSELAEQMANTKGPAQECTQQLQDSVAGEPSRGNGSAAKSSADSGPAAQPGSWVDSFVANVDQS